MLEASNPPQFQGSSNLFFQVVSHLSRGMTHGSWAWSMVLNPWGQCSGQRRGHRWIPTQWPSVISCAPCPAAHHRPRAGLRAAWRGMDWSWVQKISTLCSFPVFVGWFLLVADFWIVSCIYIYIHVFPKYWISSAILVEHFPKVWQGCQTCDPEQNYPADNAGRAKGAKIWHCHARDDGGKHPNLQLLFRVQLTVRSL